jgi:hypothetical protein
MTSRDHKKVYRGLHDATIKTMKETPHVNFGAHVRTWEADAVINRNLKEESARLKSRRNTTTEPVKDLRRTMANVGEKGI